MIQTRPNPALNSDPHISVTIAENITAHDNASLRSAQKDAHTKMEETQDELAIRVPIRYYALSDGKREYVSNRNSCGTEQYNNYSLIKIRL